jgi:hypothetical protein
MEVIRSQLDLAELVAQVEAITMEQLVMIHNLAH